jgi:toxin CcdB
MFGSITTPMTTQFDVFSNPIGRARGAYPLVVVLQSDIARDSRERVVAPLVPRGSLPKIAGRLTPIVTIESTPHVVMIPALAVVRGADLVTRVASLADARADLLDAIDYLFFGI